MLVPEDFALAGQQVDEIMEQLELDAQPLTIYLRRSLETFGNMHLAATYMQDRQIVHHVFEVRRDFPTVYECVQSAKARLQDAVAAIRENRAPRYADSTLRLDTPTFWQRRLRAMTTLHAMTIDCALFPDNPVDDIRNPELHGTIPEQSALYDLHESIDTLAANAPRIYATDMYKKDAK